MKCNYCDKETINNGVVDQFPLTDKHAYQKAVAWLKKTGNYHRIENELSKDGFTVVNLANHLYRESKK